MSFVSAAKVDVGLCFHANAAGGDANVLHVGELGRYGRTIYFEYAPSFIERGLDISPLNCPLRGGVQTFAPPLFEGLPGVFDDSLPDGWGRLLFERHMRALGVLPGQLSPLDRLCYTGDSGMGALVYAPAHEQEPDAPVSSLDTLAHHARKVFAGSATTYLPQLLALNGSSAGARAKVMLGVHRNKKDILGGGNLHKLPPGYAPWMVKFPNSGDGADAGAVEYVYSLMAADAGIKMEKTLLFPAKKGGGYFAVRRFDRRAGGARLHCHTACGLLHSDFRAPTLDYKELIALTLHLTKDAREVEKMFRLAVFNVLSHNRDDHAKNFSFLMTAAGGWKMSPAYDLTFSSGPRGEQSTLVMGEGKNPTCADLQKLGAEANIGAAAARRIIVRVQSALAKWQTRAKQHGVSKANIALIAKKIQA